MSSRIARTSIALSLVFLAACPKAPPDVRAPPDPADPLEELLRRTQALIRAQDESLWRSWTEGEPLSLQPAGTDAGALYSRESLQLIDRAHEAATDPLDRRALEQLRIHFVSEILV